MRVDPIRPPVWSLQWLLQIGQGCRADHCHTTDAPWRCSVEVRSLVEIPAQPRRDPNHQNSEFCPGHYALLRGWDRFEAISKPPLALLSLLPVEARKNTTEAGRSC